MKARIYAYTAVSSDQTDLVLQQQVEHCRAYCHEKGYEVVDVQTEAGGHRKKRDALLKQANEETFPVVVVSDVSRFSRNSLHLSNFLFELDTLGVRVESVTQGVIEMQSLMASQIIEFVGQLKRKRMQTRTARQKGKRASLLG